MNVTNTSVEGIPQGSHVCHFYRKIYEIPPVAARLMRVGLSLSEKCLFAAAPAQVKAFREELHKLQVDVQAHLEAGQLVLFEERTPLLEDGKRFRPSYLLSTHQTFAAQAQHEGWQAVRLSIDMTWLTNGLATPEHLLEYDLASDAVFRLQNAPMIALIHYDHNTLLPSQIVEMLRFHPIVMTGKYLKHNRYVDNAAQSSRGHIPRNNIPEIGKSTVLRTDFSDDRVWQVICAAIEEPVGDFRAYVTFVSDRACEGITLEEVIERVKRDISFLFIVDDLTISHEEHPILVVDLWNEPGCTFRVIPFEMWSVENNLSIANLSFWEFADRTDDDGVFRGFGD